MPSSGNVADYKQLNETPPPLSESLLGSSLLPLLFNGFICKKTKQMAVYNYRVLVRELIPNLTALFPSLSPHP